MWRAPLEIFIAWQRAESTEREGKSVAERAALALVNHFTGDINDPLQIGPEIPTTFRVQPNEESMEKLEPLPWERSEHGVLVVLVDDAMVARSHQWRDWLGDQLASETDRHRVLICALTKSFVNLSRKIAERQTIRLDALVEDAEALELILYSRISNEICRFLDPRRQQQQSTRLFVSHAKADGRGVAKQLQEHISGSPAADVFFDEVDLEPTAGFESQFIERIGSATVVLLMTDTWASRYWCQWEALQGKAQKRPIVLVDLLSSGERRHFPYLGNIPTVRCNPNSFDERDCCRIVATAQLETLRVLHEGLRLDSLKTAGQLPPNSIRLSRAPELATLPTELSVTDTGAPEEPLYVYPDPPLARHEQVMLERYHPEIQLATPIELLTGERRSLQGVEKRIAAISISNPPGLAAIGKAQAHLDRLWIALARHLLAMGFQLAYGGDLRERGFTDILFDLVRAYADEGRMLDEGIIHWFVGWPIHLKLTDPQRAALPDVIRLHAISCPKDLECDSKQFVSPAENPIAWIRSMTAMRRDMAANTDLRILVGGQRRASTPRSGILEEYLCSLEAEQPIYLCGGFGGMSGDIASLLLGNDENPESLCEAYHTQTDAARTALEAYNGTAAGVADPIDYPKVVELIRQQGIAGLRNGLTEDENERLLRSQSTEEIVGLIRRGVQA